MFVWFTDGGDWSQIGFSCLSWSGSIWHQGFYVGRGCRSDRQTPSTFGWFWLESWKFVIERFFHRFDVRNLPKMFGNFHSTGLFLFGPNFHGIFTIQTATSNWTHPLAIVLIVQGTSSLKPPGRSSYSSAEIAFDGGTSPCASVWSWDIGILCFLETWTIMNLRTVSLHQEWIWNSC